MDNNIIIKKVYDEDGLIELEIIASSEFACAQQLCYVQDTDIEANADKIVEYSQNFKQDCYVEFGNKEGKYTPAFSLKFLQADSRGHLKIEVDIEIADNDDRKHRCSYYVESELGMVERFGIAIKNLVSSEINTECRLCE
jgi:hypothetical protein